MLETDPISIAQSSLASASLEVLKGGDPNRLRAPYCAAMQAKGHGKHAKSAMELPPLAYVKPKRTP